MINKVCNCPAPKLFFFLLKKKQRLIDFSTYSPHNFNIFTKHKRKVGGKPMQKAAKNNKINYLDHSLRLLRNKVPGRIKSKKKK